MIDNYPKSEATPISDTDIAHNTYLARRSQQVWTNGGEKVVDPTITETGQAELDHMDEGSAKELDSIAAANESRRILAARALNFAALGANMSQERIDAIRARNGL